MRTGPETAGSRPVSTKSSPALSLLTGLLVFNGSIPATEVPPRHLCRGDVQVFANHPDVRRSRVNRAGTHVARRRTNGGRRVLITFVDKGDGRIRRITAWEVGK